jgi:hypothetical protein
MNWLWMMSAVAIFAAPLPAATQEATPPARKARPDELVRVRVAERKLEEWKIKKVEFSEATLEDALAFFKAEAKKLDPEKKGLNFVVSPAAAAQSKITLALDEVPIGVALRYAVEMLHLEYRVEPFVIVIDKPAAKASP